MTKKKEMPPVLDVFLYASLTTLMALSVFVGSFIDAEIGYDFPVGGCFLVVAQWIGLYFFLKSIIKILKEKYKINTFNKYPGANTFFLVAMVVGIFLNLFVSITGPISELYFDWEHFLFHIFLSTIFLRFIANIIAIFHGEIINRR